MRRVRLVGLALAFLAAPLAAKAQPAPQGNSDQLRDLFARRLSDRASTWRCDVLTRYICSEMGCEQARLAGIWIALDFSQRRYERCDANGCDRYRLDVAASGIFTVGSPGVERAGFIKVVNDGSEFVETMSLGVAAYLSFGRCTAVP